MLLLFSALYATKTTQAQPAKRHRKEFGRLNQNLGAFCPFVSLGFKKIIDKYFTPLFPAYLTHKIQISLFPSDKGKVFWNFQNSVFADARVCQKF